MAIDNIIEIEQSLGLEAGKLNEIIKSEDKIKIDLSSKVIYDKNDFDKFIDNVKKDEFTRGRDLLLKDLKDKEGLEYEGRKDPNNFIKYFREKVEAESKIEPEKKYSNLKSDFEKVQSNLEEWQNKYLNLETTYKQKENQNKIDNALLKSIPDNVSIPKNDILAIMKSRNDFKIGDDGFEVIKDGNVLKNETTRSPLTPDEFTASFIKPYLKQVEGGNGDKGGKGNPKEGTFESFDKEMENKGITGQEYTMKLNEAIKSGIIKM